VKSTQSKPTKRTTKKIAVIDLTYSPPANVARKGNSVGADIEDAIKALNLSDKIEENDTRTEDKENRINADEAVIEEESREDDVETAVTEETLQTEVSMQQQQREEEEKAIAKKLAVEAEERRKLDAIVAENVRRQIKELQDAKRLAAREAEEKAQWERMELEKAANRCREEKQKREERSILTEKTLRAASNASHYVVLGITPTATFVQIKEAYRRLSKVLHPDKNDLPNADEAFKVISNAYQVLQDASSRREYDREQRYVGDAGIPSQPSTSSSASPERSVFPIVVNIRYETRNILLRMAGSQATLMRCKVLAMGRYYTVNYVDGASPFSKTVDLIPTQFVIPNGTMVRLKYGNRDYGTIVGWTEGYDWNSKTDISYYAVRMANNVIQNVYMMNVELE
jgi:hypothetical protein